MNLKFIIYTLKELINRISTLYLIKKLVDITRT
jgi:hypothetical protein